MKKLILIISIFLCSCSSPTKEREEAIRQYSFGLGWDKGMQTAIEIILIEGDSINWKHINEHKSLDSLIFAIRK